MALPSTLPKALLPEWRFPNENPSCWTNGYSRAACCDNASRINEGGGCFETDNVDSPHSKERCCSSPCGAALRTQIIEAIENRLCFRTLQSNNTAVSGLWNLHRERWAPHKMHNEGESRAFDRYLEWLDHILRKRQALLLFLDAEAATFAIARRRAYGLERFTCVLEVPIDALPQMHRRKSYIMAHLKNQEELPGDMRPEVVRPDYTLVVNSKPELLACATLWNPFRSETFAWLDAGCGRQQGFPLGPQPFVFPTCPSRSLCIGRRPWLLYDFRSKLMRLKHGPTFDSTVLLGGRDGLLLYALWFQWAVARYLHEGIMDDEQSIVAEVWWAGDFHIHSVYGMTWAETIMQMLDAGKRLESTSLAQARLIGRHFLDTPHLIWSNAGHVQVPSHWNLNLGKQVQVNKTTDEDLVRIAFSVWCKHSRYEYYRNFCDEYSQPQIQPDRASLEALHEIKAGCSWAGDGCLPRNRFSSGRE